MEQPMLVRSNRGRAPHNSSQVASCIVDGCNSDLSKCREYHRRHKVCELHSKTPKVTIRGEEQRFCQQCSRFHYLLEFDDAKRSCRKRLDGHNRRRRKPQPDISSQSCTTSQFFSNSNYEVAKFVSSGDPHQAFLSSALGSSCSWSASPVHKTGNRGESFVSSHHQTGSMRSLSDKKIPSSFSFGGSSELLKSAPIQFPFLQEEGITTLQQAAPLIANPVNHHHQTAQFVGTSDHHHSSVRALSLLSSPAAVPESSSSQKLTPLFDPLLPTQLRLSAFDATPSNASVLVSQGMMFQVTRYGDESESSANGNRPLHHHATSFSWD